MKVVVTGATGMVGNEIVRRCLEDARITKVVILTRKAVSMDIECHPKADVIMVQDFARYSDQVLRQLEGSSACIWAIGGRSDQLNNSKAALHHVNVDLPLVAARVMREYIAPKAPAGHKFNFVFCSSKSRSTTSLLSLGDPRKPKSEAEKGLCEIADASPETFSAWILRPGGIVTPDAAPKKRRLVGGRSSAGVDIAQLAKVCVKVSVEGYKDRIIDNDTLLKL
ncbi:hypothetical protein ACHAPQ_001903 [Fusarium lateritium]